MMKRFAWMMTLSAALVLAQGKEKEAPQLAKAPQKTVLVEVKNGDVNRIASMFASLPGTALRSDSALRVITVSGDVATVNSIEEAIKRLDVAPPPQRNVELTVYLLHASAQEVPTATVPPELETTVKELRAAFSYKSYRVLDANVLRARDGERAGLSGTLPGTSTPYNFDCQRVTISSGQGPRALHIDNLQLRISFPNTSPTSIQTNLDAREGQKTVVGKANMANSEDAIFLVVTPKVVE